MQSWTRISKWGPSLAVRIPNAIAEKWEVKEGTQIEIAYERGDLVLKKRKYELEDILAQITSENEHPEIDTGPPVGDEAW